ncbi:MAG: type IX secretion system membrane protein PorP/SprF [Saprospiraceae bacterium]|nr:type IX secretion system membrane protein PorP/SprF [Saprospiraceae bacterium]
MLASLKYRAVVFGILMVLTAYCGAQQLSLQGFSYKDPYKLIPAFGGLEGTIVGSATFRNQWQGLNGHPQTFDVRLHLPLYWIRSGAGLAMGKDETGLSQQIYLQPSFNRVFHFNKILWSFAVQLQYAYHSFDGRLVQTPDGDYTGGRVEHRDPLLDNSKSSFQMLDAGFSLALEYSGIKFGCAATSLFESGKAAFPVLYKNRRHYVIYTSYQGMVGSFKYFPSLSVYTDLNKTQTEIFLGGAYNGNIFGGIHLRGYHDESLESMGISFGFELSSKWSVAYLHEFYLGKIPVSAVQRSQEFGLFYNFGKAIGQGRKPPVLKSPRYLD